MATFRFPTVASYVAHITKDMCAVRGKYGWKNEGQHDYSWDMGVGTEEAINKAINGDNRIASLANTAIEKFELPIGEIMRKQNIADFAGSRVSIPAYLGGNPRAMIRRKTMKASGKEVSVFVAISANGLITSSEMFNRGCAILALLETLQSNGAAITLNLYIDHTGYQRSFLLSVIGVETTPLDLSTAAFAIAHPAFVRNVGFMGSNMLGGFTGQAAYGDSDSYIGRDRSKEQYHTVLKNELGVKEGDIFIPRAMPGDSLLRDPAKWLEANIAQVIG